MKRIATAVLIASTVLLVGVGCGSSGGGSQEPPPPVQATTTTENPIQKSQDQVAQAQEDAQQKTRAAADTQTVAQKVKTESGLDDQLSVIVTAYCNTLGTTDADSNYLDYFEDDLVQLYATTWQAGGKWNQGLQEAARQTPGGCPNEMPPQS